MSSDSWERVKRWGGGVSLSSVLMFSDPLINEASCMGEDVREREVKEVRDGRVGDWK